MKKRLMIFTSILALAASSQLNAQPLTNDTVVCIIDTTKNYVTYDGSLFPNHVMARPWLISIDGHYYDDKSYGDFAGIALVGDSLKNVYGKFGLDPGPLQVKVAKAYIAASCVTLSEDWINQQTDFQGLKRTLGYGPSSKYNFVVFKQDYDNSETDSVLMQRVWVGYNEKQF